MLPIAMMPVLRLHHSSKRALNWTHLMKMVLPWHSIWITKKAVPPFHHCKHVQPASHCWALATAQAFALWCHLHTFRRRDKLKAVKSATINGLTCHSPTAVRRRHVHCPAKTALHASSNWECPHSEGHNALAWDGHLKEVQAAALTEESH